jgi:hypothetical protein
MKIFNPDHFLRHIAPAVLQTFAGSHRLGVHLSIDWTLPEPAIYKAVSDAIHALQARLAQDPVLTTTEKTQLEEDLFSWNEDLRRAHIIGTAEGAREFALALATDPVAIEKLQSLDPREQALWMLAEHENLFRDIELHLAFRAKTHGRYWKVHQILPNLVPNIDVTSLQAFKQDVAALYQKTGGGMGAHIEVSHRGADGSIQFTLYVEGPITAIAQFCEHDFKRIATRVALETALVYHPKSGVVETVVKGGAKNHAAVLTLFAKHLAKTELKPEVITPSRFKLSVLNDGLLAPKEDWSLQGIEKVRLRRAKFTPADQRTSAIQIEASPEPNRDDAICVAREKLKVAYSFDSEFEMDRATLMVYTRDQQSRREGHFSFDIYASGSTTIKNLSHRNQELAQCVMRGLGIVESPGLVA